MRGKIVPAVTPFDAWRITSAIMFNFKSNYDCFKYHFKMKALTPEAFSKRRDQYHYRKLSDLCTSVQMLQQYVTSNIMAGNIWIGNMNEEPYEKLLKRLQTFGYCFTSELNSLLKENASFDYWLTPKDGSIPILSKMIAEEISIEAVCVLDLMTGFLNPKRVDQFTWELVGGKLTKYKRFVEQWVDVPKCKKIALKVFTN